ncbi:hypothetical protein DSO57_1018997 [Entomophthora muscae]|uniref:Uncharacterized protein n=1 Tax=Entomophthora muscae TaxID=34485 RepID=A0ACC2RIN9_9FUNG|nr:hypothetical protein DSO57_1018997 [Entomophthora muscae]
MFKKVIKWSAKVKQLLSWAKPQNPASLPANVIKENRAPLKGPRRDPQRTDPQGGWRIPTLNRRETMLKPTWTLYVLWQSGTFSQGLPSLGQVKLGSAKTSQEVKALLDTGAIGNFISSSLAQQLGLQEGPSAWVTLTNKSRTRVTKIEGNLGVKVRNNQFDIMVSSLSNLAFPLILGFPWAKTSKAVLDLDSMTLSTQKEGITSSIPFNQTENKEILTAEDTLNVLATLKEISQA